MRNTNRKGGDKPGRSTGRRREESSRSNTGRRTEHGNTEEERPGPPRKYAGKPGKPFKRRQDDNSRETPFRRERDDRSYDPESKPRSYRKKEGEHSDDKPFRRERSDRPYDPESKPRSYRKSEGDRSDDRPFRRERSDRPYDKDNRKNSYRNEKSDMPERKTRRPSTGGLTRLNKYIANAGICSRREADELIQAGVIKVNGTVITELGYKVGLGDKVMYEDQLIRSEKLVYVLLNKPKGYITTVDDPYDRKTVMTLVESACKERIYPVGRLDRNTSGLLLLTNDGDLAKKLTHPKHNIRKVYHAELDKALTKADMLSIAGGIELEDGLAQVDEIAYAEGGSKKEIGIELHSGKNRIVRRIFESLGYEVMKLDRVIFAGLTKKDLPRGHWRMLTEKEVNFLKMIR